MVRAPRARAREDSEILQMMRAMDEHIKHGEREREREVVEDSGYGLDGSDYRADELHATRCDAEVELDGQATGGDERIPVHGGSLHAGTWECRLPGGT